MTLLSQTIRRHQSFVANYSATSDSTPCPLIAPVEKHRYQPNSVCWLQTSAACVGLLPVFARVETAIPYMRKRRAQSPCRYSRKQYVAAQSFVANYLATSDSTPCPLIAPVKKHRYQTNSVCWMQTSAACFGLHPVFARVETAIPYMRKRRAQSP